MESYLLHDANASSNFKIMMMIQKEGMKGYGIYWMILEFLRVQNGYKADVRILPVLARKMRVTVATLKRIIFDSGLFEVNDTTFSSPGLTRCMGHWKPSAKRTENRADVEDWLTNRESGKAWQATLYLSIRLMI